LVISFLCGLRRRVDSCEGLYHSSDLTVASDVRLTRPAMTTRIDHDQDASDFDYHGDVSVCRYHAGTRSGYIAAH